MWGTTIRINGLPLPRELLDLIRAGRWRLPGEAGKFDSLFPERGADASLYSLDYMPFENRHWRNETAPMFVGAPDADHPPGDIDPSRSILIADLGRGYDQPIALDYRTDPPRVLTLLWAYPPDEKNRWVVIARDVRGFAELVGLSA